LTNAGGVGDQDAVGFRRARLRVDGVMYEFIDFACEYDFVNSTNVNAGLPVVGGVNLGAGNENTVINVTAPTDLWINVKDLPILGNCRVGNMKEPLGLEHAYSSRYLNFMERSFLQDAYTGPFNNGFTPGVMFYDSFNEKKSTWAIGAFKNTQNIYAFNTGDGEYATTGRMTWLPYYDEPSEGRYLVHVGASGSYRDNDQDRLRIRSRGSLRNGPGALNPVFADTGFFESSNQSILGSEAAVVYGPWMWQAEYMCSYAGDSFGNGTTSTLGAPLGTVFTQSWYIESLVFLTGEHREYELGRASFGRVIPYENFYLVRDGNCCHCLSRGAWQFGLRYSNLDLRDSGINGGQLHDVTVGLNWFLNPNAKVQFNYSYLHRDSQGLFAGAAPEGNISGFGTRVAFDF
jgi:phosphate-selective porin OprO/OprP